MQTHLEGAKERRSECRPGVGQGRSRPPSAHKQRVDAQECWPVQPDTPQSLHPRQRWRHRAASLLLPQTHAPMPQWHAMPSLSHRGTFESLIPLAVSALTACCCRQPNPGTGGMGAAVHTGKTMRLQNLMHKGTRKEAMLQAESGGWSPAVCVTLRRRLAALLLQPARGRCPPASCSLGCRAVRAGATCLRPAAARWARRARCPRPARAQRPPPPPPSSCPLLASRFG